MASTPGAGSYRAVLALPHAAPTFGAALVGRLSFGLLPLSVLFTVVEATQSFTLAGSAVAVFGLTSLSLPLKSRLIDRFGQPRILGALALACGTALTALATLPTTGDPSPVAYVAFSVAAGLAAPPLGPAMRATWHHLTEDTALRSRSYVLDSICEEALYLLGPLLTGVIVGVASGRAALFVTAALLVTGTLLMTSTPPSRHRATPVTGPADEPQCKWFDFGPLRAPGFAEVLVSLGLAATALSVTLTCIAARAQSAAQPAAAGYIEAAVAGGSVLGALAWGRREHQRPHMVHLALLCSCLAVGVSAAAVVDNLPALGFVMAITGTAIAPLFVICYLAADDLAPAHQRTEASTWVNTANNLGSAAGASTAGVLVDAAGTRSGFVSAATLLALAASWAWLRRSPTRPVL